MALRAQAKDNGTADMNLAEINEKINLSRKEAAQRLPAEKTLASFTHPISSSSISSIFEMST